MSVILSTTDLVSGYFNRPVLHGCTVDINHGNVLALIGPNGHGKTTFLRTLSGFLQTRGGKVILDGADVGNWSVQKRVEAGLVHVPQGDQLFKEMSVLENLLMGAYLCKDKAEIDRRLEKVFGLFPKLKDRAKQVASSLSGGERRMVGIGRGLMAEAKVLMLDEPSLGLAPLVIEQIYAALRQLREEGMSLLIVEENPSRVLDFSDSICLMDAGHIVWSGKSQDAKNSGHIMKTYLGGV